MTVSDSVTTIWCAKLQPLGDFLLVSGFATFKILHEQNSGTFFGHRSSCVVLKVCEMMARVDCQCEKTLAVSFLFKFGLFENI